MIKSEPRIACDISTLGIVWVNNVTEQIQESEQAAVHVHSLSRVRYASVLIKYNKTSQRIDRKIKTNKIEMRVHR